MFKHEKSADQKNAGKKDALREIFDGRVKLNFYINSFQVTSDVGLFAYWELDEAMRLTTSTENFLSNCGA